MLSCRKNEQLCQVQYHRRLSSRKRIKVPIKTDANISHLQEFQKVSDELTNDCRVDTHQGGGGGGGGEEEEKRGRGLQSML